MAIWDALGKISDFFTKSSVNKILLVVLLLGGVFFLLAGIFGQVEVGGHMIGPGGAWRYVSLTCGIILLGLTLVQFSLTTLKLWLREQFVSTAMSEIQIQTNRLVEEGIGRLNNLNEALLKTATETLVAEAQHLEKTHAELVNKVEDATRRVLTGIPDIFERALRLISEADKELWFVNFALQFGKVHCENKAVTAAYSLKFGRLLSKDVAIFYDTLSTKAKQLPIVNILTSSEEGARNFMEPLLVLDDYSFLDELVASKKDNEKKERRYEQLIADMEEDKGAFKGDVPRGRFQRFEGATQYRCFEATSLPIQLLIAGIKSEDRKSDNRYGCLLFMVGSETRGGIEPGEEVGIYTELDNMVDVMRNLAWTIMKGAKPFYDESDSRFRPTVKT
jgi:hypothetical protein